MRNIIFLVVMLVVSFIACDNKHDQAENIIAGDTLYYSFTGANVFKCVIVRNDVKNKIFIVKQQNIFSDSLWYSDFLTYETIEKHCTRFNN